MDIGKFAITEFFIYRWRYQIGYFLILLGMIGALVFVGLYLPGGISTQEMQSTVHSSSLSLTQLSNLDVINLPYHLLQKIFFVVFGVSSLTIKLPSLLLAFLSIIGLVFLLRQWFKPRIAVLASLIAVTTGQFLFIAQNGTPDILYLFWPVWLMWLASIISAQEKRRIRHMIVFCILAALSLYTPLSIYVLIVFLIAALTHPHLRFNIIKTLPIKMLIPGLLVVSVLLTPLVYYLIKDPTTISNLLNIPSALPDIGVNLAVLTNSFFSFVNPSGTTIITPFFELGSFLIILIGAYRVFDTRSTAKSYFLAFWTILIVPMIVINPSYSSITFLPLVILLASGLNWLLTYWYELFPRNPYARIAGLLPVVILVSALVFSGVNRYIYSYKYDPSIVSNFSQDLRLIPKDTKYIVTSNDEFEFYNTVAKYNHNFSVSKVPISDKFLATRSANRRFSGFRVDRIITTTTKNNSDRFYLYQTR